MGDAGPVSAVPQVSTRTKVATRALNVLQISPSLLRFVLLVWVFSRLGFILLTALALALFRHVRVTTSFVEAWTRFDATAYARISQQGYLPSAPADFAFFPLQPLLTRALTLLTFGNSDAAALIVSNVACLVALLGLASLATVVFDEAVAYRATLYLALFPTAFFLFAGYADALFLATAIWCVVALHRHAWLQAGLLGLLAATTRQMGIFLVLPFIWEYGKAKGWRLRNLRLDASAVLLIPLGLLLFMAWLWHTVGDPLAFLHAESHWSHHATPPWLTLAHALEALPHQPDAIFAFRGVVDLAAILLFAGLIVIGFRSLPLGETLFSVCVWLLAVCYPSEPWPLQSDARYMLLIFPAFLTLARLGRNRWLNVVFIAVFAILLVLLAQYFVRGALIL